MLHEILQTSIFINLQENFLNKTENKENQVECTKK